MNYPTSRFSAEEVSRLSGLSEQRVAAMVRAGLVGDRQARRACGCRPRQGELNFSPETSQDAAASICADGTGALADEDLLAAPIRWRGAFSFRDLKVLRLAQSLIARGLKPGRVERALMRLKRQTAARHLPLSGASVQHDGERLLASDGQTVWDVEDGRTVACVCEPRPAGADGKAPEASEPEVLRRSATDKPPEAYRDFLGLPFHRRFDDADAFFEQALKLEERAPRRAFALYLRALACDPTHVEALINAGRLCSAGEDVKRALAYFRLASLVDEAHPVAHFNLAVTLHGQGDLRGATAAYRLALLHDPHFADAHYNLATLLEQQGESQEAFRHFVAFRAAIERDSGN